MKKGYILFILLLFMSFLNISYSKGADPIYAPDIDWKMNDHYQYFTRNVTIEWWWFEHDWESDDEFEYPNSATEYFNYVSIQFHIKSNLETGYRLVEFYDDSNLNHVPHSVTLDLEELGYNVTHQTFMFKISYKMYIFDHFSTSICSFIWNPQDELNFNLFDFDISSDTIILLIVLGFVFFGFGIYWYLFSCKNSENLDSTYCRELLLKKVPLSKVEISQTQDERIKEKLFFEGE